MSDYGQKYICTPTLSKKKLLILQSKDIKELEHHIISIRNGGFVSLYVYFVPLKRLFLYCKTYGILDERILEEFTIYEFLDLSHSTKAKYLAIITNFLKYSRLPYMLYLHIPQKYSNNRPIFTLVKEDIRAFYRYLETCKNRSCYSLRDATLFQLILSTGLSPKESLKLQYEQLRNKKSYCKIAVTGRDVFCSYKLYKDMELLKKYFSCKNNLVFCNKYGEILCASNMNKSLQRYLHNSSVKTFASTLISLKTSFVHMLSEKIDNDLLFLHNYLGHKSLSTTNSYIKMHQQNRIWLQTINYV